MKMLIADDEFTSRERLIALLSQLCDVDADIAENGQEAVDAFYNALENGSPYEIIFLDIMMPEMDGHEALSEMRKAEQQWDVPIDKMSKIIMTTALADGKNIMGAFREQCDGYLVKPVQRKDLEKILQEFGFRGEGC